VAGRQSATDAGQLRWNLTVTAGDCSGQPRPIIVQCCIASVFFHPVTGGWPTHPARLVWRPAAGSAHRTGPSVLVAHSYAAASATIVPQQISDRINRVVYLAAVLAPAGHGSRSFRPPPRRRSSRRPRPGGAGWLIPMMDDDMPKRLCR
jgi:hypothetical protein